MGKKTGILGAGGWGITLARILDGNGSKVTLWEPIAKNCESLKKHRENTDYFPGFAIPESITVTASIEETLSKSDILILVVRSTYFRQTVKKTQKILRGTAGYHRNKRDRNIDRKKNVGNPQR